MTSVFVVIRDMLWSMLLAMLTMKRESHGFIFLYIQALLFLLFCCSTWWPKWSSAIMKERAHHCRDVYHVSLARDKLKKKNKKLVYVDNKELKGVVQEISPMESVLFQPPSLQNFSSREVLKIPSLWNFQGFFKPYLHPHPDNVCSLK